MIDERIVLLLEGGVRDPGHYRKLLVRVGELGEEGDQILEAVYGRGLAVPPLP